MPLKSEEKMHRIDEAMQDGIGGIHYGSGGLNEGMELEDEIDSDPTLSFTLVETDPEVANAIATENRITDLKYLIQDIEKSSGINQALALEAQRIAPEFFKSPIGYFTKELSATRYKVSLEELNNGLLVLQNKQK